MKILLNMLLILLTSPTLSFSYSKKDVTTCGANPADPTFDSGPAIQTCIDAAGSEAAIYFPPGDYKVGSTLYVRNSNVTLHSDSRASARLSFTGTGDLILFQRNGQSSSPIIFNSGIRHLWLKGNETNVQTAIHVIDGSWVTVENVQISDFKDPSHESIGIKVNGREGFNIENTHIEANKPVVLGRNPNHSYIDADHFRFENMYTQVRKAGHWHFTLEDQVTVTNMTIDGQNPLGPVDIYLSHK